jgi:hypothetical protein
MYEFLFLIRVFFKKCFYMWSERMWLRIDTNKLALHAPPHCALTSRLVVLPRESSLANDGLTSSRDGSCHEATAPHDQKDL